MVEITFTPKAVEDLRWFKKVERKKDPGETGIAVKLRARNRDSESKTSAPEQTRVVGTVPGPVSGVFCH